MRSLLLSDVHSVGAGHRKGDTCLADNAMSNAGRAPCTYVGVLHRSTAALGLTSDMKANSRCAVEHCVVAGA